MVRVSKLSFGMPTYVRVLIVVSSRSRHSPSVAWYPRMCGIRKKAVAVRSLNGTVCRTPPDLREGAASCVQSKSSFSFHGLVTQDVRGQEEGCRCQITIRFGG